MKTKKVIVCILIAIIIVSVGLLGILKIRRAKENHTMEELRNQYVEQVEADDSQNSKQTEIDFRALKELNADVYAWIMVDGTDISYPVLQHQDSEDLYDDYYLNHNMDGSVGYPGVIYSEKVNSTDFTDSISILYGHNMKNQTMFSKLHEFEDKSFFEENRNFEIYTPDHKYVYEVFAAVSFSDVHLMETYGNEEDLDAFSEAINKADGNHEEDITLSQGDRVVVLSTCYANNPEKRLLVCGKLTTAE